MRLTFNSEPLQDQPDAAALARAWDAALKTLEQYRAGAPLTETFEDYDVEEEFPEIRRSVARMLSWRPLLLPRRAGSHPDDILLRGDPTGEACVIAYSDMATLLADCPATAAKHVGFAELLSYAASEKRFSCLMVHALGCWIPIPRADFKPMLSELGCPAL